MRQEAEPKTGRRGEDEEAALRPRHGGSAPSSSLLAQGETTRGSTVTLALTRVFLLLSGKGRVALPFLLFIVAAAACGVQYAVLSAIHTHDLLLGPSERGQKQNRFRR